MKKFFTLMLLVVGFAAGCGKKKEKPKKDVKGKKVEMPLADNRDNKNSFFEEDAGAFVLEDDFKKDQMAVASNDQSLSWIAESETQTKSFKPIHFDFDRYNVAVDQEPLLREDVKEAKKVAENGGRVVVEGHACHSAGSKTYNLLISEHRAQEVARRLKSEGVSESQLQVVGRGQEMPVVVGGNRDEQYPNRRVEFFALNA